MTDDPDFLDDFFAAARKTRPEPGADLLARVQADALAMQPVAGARAAPARPGLWAQIVAALGGWPAVAGLATATVAGVWIGVAQPAGLADSLSAVLYGSETLSVDPIGAFDLVLLEG